MSKKKRTGSFSPAGNGKRQRQGIILSPAEGAEPTVRTQRLGSRKRNLATQLIRGGNTPSMLEDMQFSPAGSKGKQFVVTGPRGKRSGMGIAKRAMDSLRIVEEYKKAGYDISGTTRDGVVIVKPSGAPDSFDLKQLDRAFSGAKAKNWR